MTPKKVKKARTSGNGFDRFKFVLTDALEHHTQALLQKSLVSEKGITIPNLLYENSLCTIRDFKWETLCAQPKVAAMPAVREFYANAYE
ncbi:Uncharacterized protein TCM_023988 [Theobroma cacao]|uniref:Uncharacterized protein n=1 Tax=Theobroma cacao TaxID=3641 RepID=A0A061EVY1_THECC|nr:Uncharacterized protein TCM_023988 [Theobroma cacao]